LYIRPPAGYAMSPGNRRVMRLFVQTDSTGAGAEGVRRYSYVLQDGAQTPAPDSVLSPSSTLVLHKGEPTSIWVINRTTEPTQVHWHGVEIDSPFDGVVGVGGFKGSPTPPIMPADSFEVRVTPPRRGSFMYHTHVNDIRQMSRGLWGAILILEPGESWNPSRDLVYQAGEGTDLEPVLNGKRGKDAFPPLTLQADERYRVRFMNISMGGPNLRFLLARDGAPVQWTPIAKDGFDLPAWQRQLGQADRFVSIGETMDVEVKLGAADRLLAYKAQAEAKQLLQQAGVPNLKFKLTNRNVSMPYTPVGVFLINEWRQIGLNVEHEQLETRLYINAQRSGNYEAALDFNCDFMDEPNLQLIKYISADKSPINYGRYTDRKLDELYEKQSAALDAKERYRLIREFETHALEQAYTFPTIWWHRIIVNWKQLKGWDITPSHYLNQDLADVWLDG